MLDKLIIDAMEMDVAKFLAALRRYNNKTNVYKKPGAHDSITVKIGQDAVAEGALVDNGASLAITMTADSGYTGELFVNGKAVTSPYTVSSDDIGCGVVIEGRDTANLYDLTLTDTNAVLRAYRGAEEIFAGTDVIAHDQKIRFYADEVPEHYHVSTFTVGGNAYTEGTEHTVVADTTVVLVAAIDTYDLTMDTTDVTVTVTVNDVEVTAGSDKFSYGDEAKFNFTAVEGKKILVNGDEIASGATVVVTEDITVKEEAAE